MRHLAAFSLLLLAACTSTVTPVAQPVTTASAPCNPGVSLVNASLWYQAAAEYDANALQIFNNARRAVDAALATTGDKPPAVILDLDETVLDNSAFEGRMVRKGITYDLEDWFRWVDESAAKPIAGAAEFLTYIQSRGVTPFYITNRTAREEAGTRRNLERLGFPLIGEDNLFVRGEREEWASSDKGPRRDFVASRYRVLAVVGDDLNDFANAHDASIEERDEIVRRHAADWGTRWFILPNPMYGSWERAIIGSSKGCEALEKKIEALKPN
jgi:5'-nucleotidase (lipoprotein e(P4) family)